MAEVVVAEAAVRVVMVVVAAVVAEVVKGELVNAPLHSIDFLSHGKPFPEENEEAFRTYDSRAHLKTSDNFIFEHVSL